MTAASRQRLAVIFGGRSVEHEVSVTSAGSVMREADSERFEVIPFGITRGGAWLTPQETQRRLEAVAAGETRAIGDDAGEGMLAYPQTLAALREVDVVFPIVHGTFGEDGTLQPASRRRATWCCATVRSPTPPPRRCARSSPTSATPAS